MFAERRVQRIAIDLNKSFFFIKWLHHEKEDIRNKWKIISTYTDIVVTYFVLVNIQLGRKKFYRSDNEPANQSIQGDKCRIFLANQIAVFLARCETVLARHFLLTFQEEHEIWWENLIMNQINGIH